MKIAPTIQTRVTGLHFDTGDRIGLSIAKGSETYVQNVLMTYDGTAFTAADLLWYNDSNENRRSRPTILTPNRECPRSFPLLQTRRREVHRPTCWSR